MPKKNKQARKSKEQLKVVMYFNKNKNKDMVTYNMIQDFTAAFNKAEGPNQRVGEFAKTMLRESLLRILAQTEEINEQVDSEAVSGEDQE